jgi:Leucine-rich repeat (LRR) protein
VQIENNVISTVRFPEIASNSFAVQQANDRLVAGSAEPILNNATISGNKFTDLDKTQATGRTFFLDLNSAKNIVVSNNTIGAMSGMPFLFESSVAGLQSITISGNTVKDFGTNSGPYGHYAFYFDLKASTNSGGKPGFVHGIAVATNTFSLDNPTTHHALIAGEWEYGALTGLEMTGNSLQNIPHKAAGVHASEIESLVH